MRGVTVIPVVSDVVEATEGVIEITNYRYE